MAITDEIPCSAYYTILGEFSANASVRPKKSAIFALNAPVETPSDLPDCLPQSVLVFNPGTYVPPARCCG
jgi:hypothetical protein